MGLPGIWSDEDVRRLIKHYREVGERAGEVYALLVGSNVSRRVEEELQTDANFALARAAELAFAIDDVSLGRIICQDIFKRIPRTPMECVLWTMCAVLLDKAFVELSGNGITVLHSMPERIVYSWPWPEASVAAAQMGKMLVTAAFASNAKAPLLTSEMQDSVFTRLRPAARIAIMNSAEHRVAEAWQLGEALVPGLAALRSLEVDYANRLNFMRAVPQWKLQRNNGSLLDWPLLMLWLGIFREPKARPQWEASNKESMFLRQLAYRLSERPDQRF